jgi:hypothetical protein
LVARSDFVDRNVGEVNPVNHVRIGKKAMNEAETQSLASIYPRQCAVLEELRKSLLHQTFNGDI